MTNLAFIKHRLALRLSATGTANDVLVRWVEIEGGTLDVSTEAMLSGVQTPASGVLRALGVEEPARSVVRQNVEIQAGDLLLEVDAAAMILKDDGSAVALDTLETPRFLWAGRWYEPKEAGEGLVSAWNAVVCNQRLYRTLLLRRAT